MIKRFLCYVSWALLVSSSAFARTVYVAPDGNDNGSGRAQQPLATILAARDAARAVKGPNTILLAPGRYFNEKPIVLDDRDSGLSVRGSQPGAVAEIYGGVPVTDWEKWKGDIWRAPVPKDQRFFNLIVDGKPAVMARTPNAGSGYGGGVKGVTRTQGAKVDRVTLPRAWRTYDFSDAQIFTFENHNWFSEMRSVLGPPDADGNVDIVLGGRIGRVYIRGVLEFLDEPGEWCLKHKDGYLYYWPVSGTPMDHLIVRSIGEKLFVVKGRTQETPAKDITLENISIIGSDFCENWLSFFPDGPGNSTRSEQEEGMVFGENVENLTVRNCRLLAAGQSAVWLNHYAQSCVVENNLILGAGFVGVYMNGWTIGEGPFKSVAESYVNKDHRIENNFIYDCGKLIGAGCGVQAYQSGDNLIARNEIAQMPRYGVSCKGDHHNLNRPIYGQQANEYDILHTRNNRIIGNDIHNVMRDSNDGGAIESWGVGRDNLWANNAVHDIDWSLRWTGHGVVVYADAHSNYLTQRNNIVYSCFSGYGTAFNADWVGSVVENNFVADCSLARFAYAHPDGPGKHIMRHNVFAFRPFQERYTARNDTIGITEFDRNVVYPRNPDNPNPERYAKIGVDVHSYFGDPGIVRAKPAWDIQYADYSLKKNSPAYELGYRDIPTDTIGLRENFPFDPVAATRRSAFDKIQAEDYQRMRDLRTRGGEGIEYMALGAWAKYENIDFGRGDTAGAELRMQGGRASIGPVQIFLDAPTGAALATFEAGKTHCKLEGIKGIHNVFLVFPEGQGECLDWFRFVSSSVVDAWEKEKDVVSLNMTDANVDAPMKVENGILFGADPGMVRNKAKGGSAVWTFEIPEGGRWNLSVLAQTPSGKEDSFYIDLGKESFVLNNQITGSNWRWLRVGTIKLDAGTNKLAIAQREPHAKIRRIQLTPIPARVAKESQPVATDMVITADTPWIVANDEPEAVQRALADVQRDWYKVFGHRPVILSQVPNKWSGPMIYLGTKQPPAEGLPNGDESFVLRVQKNEGGQLLLVAAGADKRGAIYAAYALSEEVLGVDPWHYWTDHEPATRREINVPVSLDKKFGPPTFRYRGWFINDEDLLGGFAPDPLRENVFSLEMLDRICETILRLRGNMIVPGTFNFADERCWELASRRGLALNMHHILVVGLNTFRWPKDVPFSYSRHPEIMERYWRDCIATFKGKEVVWTVGYRGKHDVPFWVNEPGLNSGAARGAAITKAIAKQVELIREVDPHGMIIANLWAEGAGMMHAGLLKLPEGVVVVWPDNSGNGYITDNGKVQAGQGMYYHTAMYNTSRNQLSELIPPGRICSEFGRFVNAGATNFCLVNVSDVRPVPLSTDTAMRFIWNAAPYLGKTEKENMDAVIMDWSRRQFGEELAADIAAIYERYFSIPYHRGRGNTGDNRLHRHMRRPNAAAYQFARNNRPYVAELAAAAQPLLQRVPEKRRDFFQAHVLTPIQIHLQSLIMLENYCAAKAALAKKENGQALALAERAMSAADALFAALHRAEKGKWASWYAGDMFVRIEGSRDLVRVFLAQLKGEPVPPVRTEPVAYDILYQYQIPFQANFPLLYPNRNQDDL